MISIHLRRTGAKKDPHYRVVVADSRDARDGAFIEVLGHYHPRFEPAKVVLDVEKTKAWIDKGAQPSDTVRSLLRKLETGALDAEQAVAPSRHRAAPKQAPASKADEPQAEVVAAEPEQKPAAAEPEAEASAEAGEKKAVEEKEAAAEQSAAEQEASGDEAAEAAQAAPPEAPAKADADESADQDAEASEDKDKDKDKDKE